MINGIKISKIYREKNYSKEMLVIDYEDMDLVLSKCVGKLSKMYKIEITSNNFDSLKEYFVNTYNENYFTVHDDDKKIIINTISKGSKRKKILNIVDDVNFVKDEFDDFSCEIGNAKISINNIEFANVNINITNLNKNDLRKAFRSIIKLIASEKR